jgi:hypothetical protein
MTLQRLNESLVGTSGYSYKEWKGNFYPEDLPAKEMLSITRAACPRRNQQHLLSPAAAEHG